MRRVSKDELFKVIYNGKLDVHPFMLSGRYPYTSLWKFPRRPGEPVFGKSVGRIERNENGVHETDYFLAEQGR